MTIPGLDFRPAYWEIGNEPELWNYWGEPWGHPGKKSQVNDTQYAAEVAAYIPVMDHANPTYTPKIIGLPGAGKGNGKDSQWIGAVINATGTEISGIAIHSYPNGPTSGPNTSSPPVQGFYAGLVGPSSLAGRVNSAEKDIAASCKLINLSCHLPIFLTEIGTALAHLPYGPYAPMFPGALGYAVQATEMLSFNSTYLASADVFSAVADTENSWIDLNGRVRPSYVVYSDVLSHLGNDAFAVTVTGAASNVTAVATVSPNDSNRHDLLVVNTNVSGIATFDTSFINSTNTALSASVRAATFQAGAPVEIWTWSGTNVTVNASVKWSVGSTPVNLTYNSSEPSTLAPVPHYYPNGLPGNFTLPPQSLALFESYNAPAYPVQFTESGLNLTSRGETSHWFLDVNGTHTTSNSTNLTLLLPTGRTPPMEPR